MLSGFEVVPFRSHCAQTVTSFGLDESLLSRADTVLYMYACLLNSVCFLFVRGALGLVAMLSDRFSRRCVPDFIHPSHIRTFSIHCLPRSECPFALGTVLR